jgi:Uma2 family endonuclease
MAQPARVLPESFDLPNWPRQGDWTWADYLRLPEDGQRYEIIQGVLYVSPAPSFDHQFSVLELAARFRSFVRARELGLVLVAPFDVRLPGVANPVQPDLIYFRAGNVPRAGDQHFEGVPDLVAEVLSPGTSRLDQYVKFGAYEKAGVREYWLLDPKSRTVAVYILESESGEYEESGRFNEGEAARSGLLDGFEAEVSDLFPSLEA